MIAAGSITTIGENHLKKSRVCQDSSGHSSYGDYSIISVADGHGGEKYIHSDLGSKFAVESSIEVLSEFMRCENDVKHLSKSFNDTICEIQQKILEKWSIKVKESDATLSATDAQSTIDGDFHWNRIEEKYGTTLIAAVMTDRYSFGFQIGDGDCLVVDRYGNVKKPIPEDPNCFFNITTSMCQNDALSSFRSFYVDEPMSMISISTDGYSSSFETEQSFERNTLAILSAIRDESFWNRLEHNVKKRASSNRMDDVSIALAFRDDIQNEAAYQLYIDYYQSPEGKSITLFDNTIKLNLQNYSFKKRSGGYYGKG